MSALKGLTNVASPSGLNGSTYNTVKWNAAQGPPKTIRDMAAAIETDSGTPPYWLVLSENLFTGFYTFVGSATADMNELAIHRVLSTPRMGVTGGDTSMVFFDDHGTTTNSVIKPLPAAGAADGVALLGTLGGVKTHEFGIQQAPSLSVGPADTHSKVIPAKITAGLGMHVIHPNQLCYHDRVDLA